MADVKTTNSFTLSCPLPKVADDRIVLAHGGGGRLTHQLIEKIFLPAFASPALEQRHDGAVLSLNGSRLAFTTDSFVVQPLMFPGGNICDLAIHGTVNDLAMCGARPLYLSAGFILEEGLSMDTLRTIVTSMQEAAAQAKVHWLLVIRRSSTRAKGTAFSSTPRASASSRRTSRQQSARHPCESVIQSSSAETLAVTASMFLCARDWSLNRRFSAIVPTSGLRSRPC